MTPEEHRKRIWNALIGFDRAQQRKRRRTRQKPSEHVENTPAPAGTKGTGK